MRRLFKSDYEGVISEAGLGVPLQAAILGNPGASDFLLMGLCPYNQEFQPKIQDRAVSEAMVVKMAEIAFNQAKSHGFPRAHKKLFSMAISGTHIPHRKRQQSATVLGQSHAWASVMTEDNIFVFHVKFWDYYSRKSCIAAMRWVAENILAYALLDRPISYSKYHSALDVIRAPDYPLVTKLDTCFGRGSSVVYFDKDGHMQRPTDVLRKTKLIYRGSFNPVTNCHLEIGQDALFELSINNQRKGQAEYTDIAHRIAMLNLAGQGVLVTEGMPRFVQLRNELVHHYGLNNEAKFVMGMDTFNRVVTDSLGPHKEDWVDLKDCIKLVVNKRGKIPAHDAIKDLNVELIDRNNEFSSTQARAGDHSGISPRVSTYIMEHKVY